MIGNSKSIHFSLDDNHSNSVISRIFSMLTLATFLTFVGFILFVVFIIYFIPIYLDYKKLSMLSEFHTFASENLSSIRFFTYLILGIGISTAINLLIGFTHKKKYLMLISSLTFIFSIILFIKTLVMLMPD
ncbi:MAG: hypothetical protein IPH62_19345 [Ignavibacteriae bacterium]|nr:hypothetical protein [Ignavibacteriota bacterium]